MQIKLLIKYLLLKQDLKNFREALKKDTENSLGDRSRYIGASDISGCLRSSYLSKVAKKEDDISQLLTF